MRTKSPFRPRAFLALLAAVSLLACGNARAAPEQPPADPLPLRRVLLSPDGLPEELDRVRQGILVKLSRDDFEARVKGASLAGEVLKNPPRLVEARYQASLVETALTGRVQWKILNPAPGPNILALEPLSLALQRVLFRKSRFDTTEAVLGELDGKTLGLLVPQTGEQSALIDWSARGDLRSGGLHFSFQVPPCAIATLELNLPADRMVVPRETYLVSGPHPAEAEDRRLWQIDFAGRSQVQLEVRQAGPSGQPAPPILASLQTRQELEPDQVRSQFDFTLEVPHQSVQELQFEGDSVLRPYEVYCRTLDRWETHPGATPEAPFRLAVHLREPFQGGLVQIRCLAPLTGDKTWTCPNLHLVGTIPRGEDLLLRVHPDIRLENWQPGSFRVGKQSPPDLPSGRKADGWLVFPLTIAGPETGATLRRPSALLHLPGPTFRARQLTWWQIAPESTALTTVVTFEVSRGQLFRIPLLLPPGWDVGGVDLSPVDWLRNWGVVSENGRQTLVVDLQRAFGPGTGGPNAPPLRLVVRLRPTQRPLVPPAGAELVFPDVVPTGAEFREGAFGISVDPIYGVEKVSASLGASATEEKGPWGKQVLDYAYSFRGRPLEGMIALRPRQSQVRARCTSEVVLTSGRAASVVRLVLQQEVANPETIALYVSAPVSGPWNWKTRRGRNQVREMRRLRGAEVLPCLGVLASRTPLEAVGYLATPLPQGEVWLLTLARPLRESLDLETTLEVAGTADASSHPEVGSPHSEPPGKGQCWDIPLPVVLGTDSMEGEVNLHLAKAESVQVEATGLRETAAASYGNPPAPWRTFHFGRLPVALTLRGQLPAAEQPPEEVIDRASLVTSVQPEGHLLQHYSFRVWNWRQPWMPLLLPPGTQPLEALADGRWSAFRNPSPLIQVAAEQTVPIELTVPAGPGPHDLEIIYKTDVPAWRLWARLQVSAPKLPVQPLSFRRTWRLPSHITPVFENRYTRLPGPNDDRADMGGDKDRVLPLLPAPFQRPRSYQRQLVEEANAALDEQERAGQAWLLGAFLDRMVFDHFKEQEALVLDAAAFQEAGLSPNTLLLPMPEVKVGSAADEIPSPEMNRKLVFVPCRSAALLTTRKQWQAWDAVGNPSGSLPELVEKAVTEAVTGGHDVSGRFRNVADWLAGEERDRDGLCREILTDYSRDPGWNDWQVNAGLEPDESLIIVRQELIPWLGVVLAEVLTLGLFLVVWRGRRYSSRVRLAFLLLWLGAGTLGYLWLPASLRWLACWPTLAGSSLALLWYLSSVVAPRYRHRPTLGKMTAVLALAGLLSLTGRAAAPGPFTVYLLPDQAAAPDKQTVLVPPALLDQLEMLTRRGATGLHNAVLLGSRYEGTTNGDSAHFRAEFQVYSFAEESTALTLPLSGLELNEALLDGVKADPVALRPPREGYAVTVAGRGVHTLVLRFTLAVSAMGGDRDLQFAIPDLAQSRLTLEVPAGSLFLHAIAGRGIQTVTSASGLANPESLKPLHLEVDLGRVGLVHIRWRPEGGHPPSPLMHVREAYLWDIRPSASSLLAVLQYTVQQGAATSVTVDLPEGCEIRSVEAGRLPDAGPDEEVPRLKDWPVPTGQSHQVRLEFQRPVTTGVQVTLELVPRLPFPPNASLLLPVPVDALPFEEKSKEPLFAYSVEGMSAKIADHLGIRLDDPKDFQGPWQQAGMRDPDQEMHAFRFHRTPGRAPVFRLTLAPLPSGLNAEQQLDWQVGPRYADLRAGARLSAPGHDLVWLDWELPPGLAVAEVSGPELRTWSQSGSRIQVWWQHPVDNATLQMTGWLPLDEDKAVTGKPDERPAYSPLAFRLSPLRLISAQPLTTLLRVTADSGLALKPGGLKNLWALPDPRASEVRHSFVTDQAAYGGLFHLAAAKANADVKVLTLAAVLDRTLTFNAILDCQVRNGEMQTLKVTLRNWKGGDVHFEGPGVVVFNREPSVEHSGRSWTLDLRGSGSGHLRVKVTGNLPLEGSDEFMMPDLNVEGAAHLDRWLAVAEQGLKADEARGLVPLPDGDQLLHSWPDEGEKVHWTASVWKINSADWQLHLLHHGPEEGGKPVRVVLSEQSAAVVDGRRWAHQATYWLYHETGTDLNVALPAGASVLSVDIDGTDVTPLQSKTERLWLPLSGPGGSHSVHVRWLFPGDGEMVDRPNLECPHLENVTEGSTLWSVQVPEGYQAGGRGSKRGGEVNPISAAEFDLQSAEAQLQLSAALAERRRGSAGGLFAVQLRTAQERFYCYCRQAEHRLTAGARSNAGVTELRDRNRQLAEKQDFEMIRAQAEKQLHVPAPSVMPDAGLETVSGSEPVPHPYCDFFPERGTSTYWLAAGGKITPALSLIAVQDHEVSRGLLLTVALILLLLGIWVLGKFRRLLAWVQVFWPEQMLLLGMAGWGMVGPSWAFLFLALLGVCGRAVRVCHWLWVFLKSAFKERPLPGPKGPVPAS